MIQRITQIACLLCLGLGLVACSDDANNVVQGYIEGELTYIASSQSGTLTQLAVHRGQLVQQGQLLFKLDDQPQADALAEAVSQLGTAEATLQDIQLGARPEEIQELQAQIRATQAAIDYYHAQMQRYKSLAQSDFASESQYDEALYEFDNSSAELKDLQAQLALAYQGQRINQIKAQQQTVAQNSANVAQSEWNLAQKQQQALANGLVFDTYYLPGEWVAAGQPVLSLQMPEQIRVIFFVSETQLSQIKLGDHVVFHCDSCHRDNHATIDYIANQNEYTPPVIYSEDMRDKLVYEVKAVLDSDQALDYHPGQPVDVALNGRFA